MMLRNGITTTMRRNPFCLNFACCSASARVLSVLPDPVGAVSVNSPGSLSAADRHASSRSRRTAATSADESAFAAKKSRCRSNTANASPGRSSAAGAPICPKSLQQDVPISLREPSYLRYVFLQFVRQELSECFPFKPLQSDVVSLHGERGCRVPVLLKANTRAYRPMIQPAFLSL